MTNDIEDSKYGLRFLDSIYFLDAKSIMKDIDRDYNYLMIINNAIEQIRKLIPADFSTVDRFELENTINRYLDYILDAVDKIVYVFDDKLKEMYYANIKYARENLSASIDDLYNRGYFPSHL